SIDLGIIGVARRFAYDAAFGAFPDTPSTGQGSLWQGYVRGGIDTLDGALRHQVTVFHNETDRRFYDYFYAGDRTPANTFVTRSDFTGTRTGGEYQATANLAALGRVIFGARSEEERILTSSQDVSPLFMGLPVPGQDAGQTTNSGFALW